MCFQLEGKGKAWQTMVGNWLELCHMGFEAKEAEKIQKLEVEA